MEFLKDLCLYGLIVKRSQIGMADKDNKLEPSDLDHLIQDEVKKKQNENDPDHLAPHSEKEKTDSSENKSKKFNNKKLNNNSKSNKRDNENGKSSKFVRNNSGRQYQTQANQSSSYNTKYNENDTLQYLKEAQVPLFNYKNLVNSMGKFILYSIKNSIMVNKVKKLNFFLSNLVKQSSLLYSKMFNFQRYFKKI